MLILKYSCMIGIIVLIKILCISKRNVVGPTFYMVVGCTYQKIRDMRALKVILLARVVWGIEKIKKLSESEFKNIRNAKF